MRKYNLSSSLIKSVFVAEQGKHYKFLTCDKIFDYVMSIQNIVIISWLMNDCKLSEFEHNKHSEAVLGLCLV